MNRTGTHTLAAALAFAFLASMLPAQKPEPVTNPGRELARLPSAPALLGRGPAPEPAPRTTTWPVPPPNCPDEPPVAAMGCGGLAWEWVPATTRLVSGKRWVGPERRQVWCDAETEAVKDPNGRIVTVVHHPAGPRTIVIDAHFEIVEIVEVLEPGRWRPSGG